MFWRVGAHDRGHGRKPRYPVAWPGRPSGQCRARLPMPDPFAHAPQFEQENGGGTEISASFAIPVAADTRPTVRPSLFRFDSRRNDPQAPLYKSRLRRRLDRGPDVQQMKNNRET